MLFDDARLLDSVAYDLVLGDYPRGINRARINDLANGLKPYTTEQEQDNNIQVNFNDLSLTRLAHDARSQMNNGLFKTGNTFSARTDWGRPEKTSEWGITVTNAAMKYIRRSVDYYEGQRSKFGNGILHGIGPKVWETDDDWCSVPLDVGDVLIPSNTLLGFRNLPLFVIRRSFTGMELRKLVNRVEQNKRNPGWNMKLVKRILAWLDSQLTQLRSTNWPEVWAPEKVAERVKQDGGYYLGDQVPTIDTFDIYGWVNDEEETGWVRRIILDSWGTPSQSGISSSGTPQYSMSRSPKRALSSGGKDDYGIGEFLFTSGKRKVAQSWRNIVTFQFADLSPVFPSRYHSIRSLGWLVFATCHIQNRMRCKFYEAVFETLNMMFEVDSMDDAQRAIQLNLTNRAFIDKSIRPIKAADRWQVNQSLVEMGMSDVANVIAQNSSSYVQNQNYSQDRTEKTKFQVMAEQNAVTSLVSAALNQAYQYEVFEDMEILRRFLRKESRNTDVQRFRAEVIKKGVPEKVLVPEAWDVEHERVMGGGNKTQEMQIASWLMEQRDKYEPQAQRVILRDATLAVTDNPDKAKQLVPEQPVVSDSVHDAQLAAATLLLGLPMAFKEGVNHQEYASSLLGAMGQQVQKIMQRGGVPTMDELSGLQNLAGQSIQGQPIKGNGVSAHIQVLAQNEADRALARKLSDVLKRLMNQVKAFAQRLMEQQKKSQQQNGQNGAAPKPQDVVKAQLDAQMGKQKMEQRSQSHAQRSAEREIDFQAKMRQEAQKHSFEIAKSRREHVADLAAKDLEAASNIRRTRLTSVDEGEDA